MTDEVPSPRHGSEPGWYPDPDEIVGTGRLRYWDGHRWTDHHAQTDPSSSEPAGSARRTGVTEQNLLVAAIVLVVIVGALVVVNALRSDAAVPQLDRNLSSSGPAV